MSNYPGRPADPLSANALAALQRLALLGRQSLQRGDFAQAEQSFAQALQSAPGDPRLLQAHAEALQCLGRPSEAAQALKHALQRQPKDAVLHSQLGMALADAGDLVNALQAQQHACELAPDSAANWFNLGKMLRLNAHLEESLAALQRALEIAPTMESAHFLMAEALMMLGRIEDSARQYRQLLRHTPNSGLAWWGLANLKSIQLSQDDITSLRRLLQRTDLPVDERIAASFSLAKALDDQDLRAESYAAYVDANATARRRFGWNAQGFSAWVDGLLASFERTAAIAIDSKLGSEVIFVIGMPRSASTLTEQILAAHAEVEGGSELPDMGLVLNEESRRLGQPFPHWVATATPNDWQRLGQRYLERTARWRTRCPRFTDKAPSNWILVGAIRAMLPAARIVDCRRDALETCWSCFRQIFWNGHEYSYDLEDLADYRRVYLAAMQRWCERHDSAIYVQVYEQLMAEPENQTRALLDACGLPFDAACLSPHLASRSVRTASAAQVRQPMQGGTARLPRYAALLDPLRQALARRGIKD
ncbi:MAG: sulfotransferase [Dokdonella sp.]